jgi:hypothetical protein
MKPEKQLTIEKHAEQYKGLPKILYAVRWSQHFLSIVAEVLILLSFAASSMDTSLGGIMSNIVWFKWIWAAMLALGVDTAFVIAWVRVRQSVVNKRWASFTWNLLLALGMSFIVFQPVAIQLLQQSLAIGFNSALSQLGINIVILVYARAFVAVLLGGILALTNIDEQTSSNEVSSVQSPKRRIVMLDRMLDKIAPMVDVQQVDSVQCPASSVQISSVSVQIDNDTEQSGHLVIAQSVQHESVQCERPFELKPVLTPFERVKQALDIEPDASDRRIAQLSNVAPTTAGKYRKMLDSGQREAV